MDDSEDSESRTTAVGLVHYAHSYAASAIALIQAKVDAVHAHAPIGFLFAHSMELYLKAFCRTRGVTVAELRSRSLGHDLEKLLERAEALGLEADPLLRAQFAFLNDAIRDRYIETGSRSMLPEAVMRDMCIKLHSTIAPVIYAKAGLRRRPPPL